MSESGSVLSTLAAGGLGATIGGIATAVIQAFSHRHESKATAAELITNAAGTLVARVDQENKQLRKAVLLLVEVLDEVVPALESTPVIKQKLLEAKKAAQRAVVT